MRRNPPLYWEAKRLKYVECIWSTDTNTTRRGRGAWRTATGAAVCAKADAAARYKSRTAQRAAMSVFPGNESLVRHGWTDVAAVLLPARKHDLLAVDLPVGDEGEQVREQVEPGRALVVGFDHVPG